MAHEIHHKGQLFVYVREIRIFHVM
ncbi:MULTISPECIES: DinB family protein [Aeribacillus]|nr:MULTISPECIES: DinB family protein [Aeribacillus]MED0652038.1 DinB family protein [Aeribacillus composti]MED0703344.1 DinB family protein [Aeribacillus composti]MED1442929.1 DinB family protein [Aeribacillus composti]MED4485354.1 DinB family protein [Aeribacillus pallidus]